uniref:class I SAM-dependent methyltransferase n=1 Tax=Algoriphagus sp. TaxID=1872435 RepID=UPI0040475C88
MKFNKEYTDYWESATKKSIDGLLIPGPSEAKTFLLDLSIQKDDKILDMGCSYGRMFEELSKHSKNIYGVDIDPFAVEKAKLHGYKNAAVGTAENSTFNNDFFDVVFSWQVFDVVDQLKGFVELNRILKIGGRFLVTGKNYNYFEDDSFAFKAEKNAFLKNFPNRFTKLNELNNNIGLLGFKINKLLLFDKRGDFGLLNYSEADLVQNDFKAYEYLLICEKTNNILSVPELLIESPFSAISIAMVLNKKFNSPKELFESIGID